MARLQILPLPEGTGDDRPPFALVIDEAATGPDGELLIKASDFVVAREDIGACDVFLFEETVEIPANAPPPLPGIADDAERAGTTQIVYAHERTRLDLCAALLLSGDTTWRKLVEQVGERQREIARLYRELNAVKASPNQPGEAIGLVTNDTDAAERALRAHVDATRKAGLTEALGMDRTRDWDDIVNAARGLRKERDAQADALERVRMLSEHPIIMDAMHPEPDGYVHGYKEAIREAKRAARKERLQTAEDRG
jgi:hypothetical protein